MLRLVCDCLTGTNSLFVRYAKMCSVIGCDSWRRGAQRFTLPEEPQIRITWIQFVAEANGLKWNELLGHFDEALWNNITICREHFSEECFEKPVESDRVKLKPDAVPTVRIKSKADQSMDILQEVSALSHVSLYITLNTFNHLYFL